MTLSCLDLETDATDMPLMGRQGKRNSPEFVTEILDSLMALRKESKQEILQACLQNVSTGLVNL